MKCLMCCAALCWTLCLGVGAHCLDRLDVAIPDCREALDAVVAVVAVGCDADVCPLTRVLRTSPGEIAAGLLGFVTEPEPETSAASGIRQPRTAASP